MPVISAWKLYTPLTAGLGVIAGYYFFWRRVGEDLQLRGAFLTGTVTGDEARIGFPQTPIPLVAAGLSLIPTPMLAGYATYGAATGSTFAPTIIVTASTPYFNVGAQNVGSAGITPLAGNAVFNNNSAYYFFASCPIAGWLATQ